MHFNLCKTSFKIVTTLIRVGSKYNPGEINRDTSRDLFLKEFNHWWINELG